MTLTALAALPPPEGLWRSQDGIWRRPYERRSTPGFKRGRRLCFLDGNLPRPTPHARRSAITPQMIDALNQPGVVRIAARPRGHTRMLTANDIDALDLYELAEITRPSTWRTQRNFTGKVSIPHARGTFHGWYWSDLEYDHYLELAWEGFDELNTQFMRIYWHWPDGTVEHHDPDAAYRRDGQFTLFDVTAEDLLDDKKRRSFDLTMLTANTFGWNYEVGTERRLPEVRRANLAFIELASEHPPVPRVLRTPLSLSGLASAYGGGAAGNTRALRALWQREYFIDMRESLDSTCLLAGVPRTPRRSWVMS